MGSNPYFYFTPYKKNVQAALDELREREFKAGRYDPAMCMADPPSYMFKFKFPPDETSPAPGPRHASIAEAVAAGEAEGTRSILDIERITDRPGFFAACPLPPHELIALFGTVEPTRKQLETVLISADEFEKLEESVRDASMQFWNQIDRGHGRYIVLYDTAEPREIFFVGYSVD